MSMVKKNILVTALQDSWIKAQIETGHFGNESELIRELIHERQMRGQETPAEVEAIPAAMIQGEESGLSNRGVDEIWEEARRHGAVRRPTAVQWGFSCDHLLKLRDRRVQGWVCCLTLSTTVGTSRVDDPVAGAMPRCRD